MRKTPLGLWSTKTKLVDPEDNEGIETETRHKKKHIYVFISVKELQDELVETIYLDKKGKLPGRSSKGNQYIMIICEIDSGEIMVEPMRNWMLG